MAYGDSFERLGASLGVTGTLFFSDNDAGHVANSVITAAVALSAAVLTVWATDRCQARQLDHDIARLDVEVDAEQRRLEDQLAHDRTLSNVAVLRVVLEDVLQAADQARDAIFNKWEATVNGEDASIADKALDDALASYGHGINRLEIRLGDPDPILRAKQGLLVALQQLHGAAEDAESVEEMTSRQDTLVSAYRAMVD